MADTIKKTPEQIVEELKKANKLPDEVAAKFDCVGVVPGRIIHKGESYDLRKITLAEAEILAKDEKFPYLVEKKAASATKTV